MGNYVFTNLLLSDYTLSMSGPTGMNLTGYQQGTDPTRESDIDPTMGEAAGTLTATQSTAALDAGFVALGNTSTNLTASTPTSVFGQAVTFTASISSPYLGTTPTGSVLFYNGLTLLGSASLTTGMMGGQASITISTLPLGSNSITAVYSGAATFVTSTSSVLNETVQQATTFTSLSESSPTSAPGQAVTFTATVSSSYLGSNPTGTVNFFDGPTLLCTVGLTAGMMGSQAIFTTSTLPLGGNPITAVYSGDATFLTSTSSASTETVQQASTSISLTESAPSSWPTQAVTFTAMISSSYLASAPTGTVAFLDGTTLLGTVGVTAGMMGGQAIFTTSALALGSHDITAVYSGDTPNAGSTSSSVNQLVWQAVTTTTLSESASSTWPTQAVTFTATIATSTFRGVNPTGTVSFFDNGTLVGTAGVTPTMMGGQAIFTTSALALGNHNITAVYSGDSPYAGSPSPAITQTVQRISVMEMESTSNSYAMYGQAVTFTATIYSMGGVAPTGTVSFWDGSTLLATINLSQVGMNYQAAFTTSTLSRGSHTIVAVYSGDLDFNSASASIGETIS